MTFKDLIVPIHTLEHNDLRFDKHFGSRMLERDSDVLAQDIEAQEVPISAHGRTLAKIRVTYVSHAIHDMIHALYYQAMSYITHVCFHALDFTHATHACTPMHACTHVRTVLYARRYSADAKYTVPK